MKRNLILTTGSNYNFRHLLPFFSTLEDINFKGDVVFFSNKISNFDITKFTKINLIEIPFNNAPPVFQDSELNSLLNTDKEIITKTLRYLMYKAYLQKNIDQYNHVLISDIRDVVFQDNPFKYPLENGLSTFLEDNSQTIKTNFYNSQWIREGFGQKTLDLIGHNTISCSGVSFGTPKAIIDYVDVMTPFIEELNGKNCRDQGIHNYIIYSNKLNKVNLIKDDSSFTSTISTFKDMQKLSYNDKGQVMNLKGEVCPIVHQYDRNWKLLWKYNKPVYFKRRIDLFKRAILSLTGR